MTVLVWIVRGILILCAFDVVVVLGLILHAQQREEGDWLDDQPECCDLHSLLRSGVTRRWADQ